MDRITIILIVGDCCERFCEHFYTGVVLALLKDWFTLLRSNTVSTSSRYFFPTAVKLMCINSGQLGSIFVGVLQLFRLCNPYLSNKVGIFVNSHIEPGRFENRSGRVLTSSSSYRRLKALILL